MNNFKSLLSIVKELNYILSKNQKKSLILVVFTSIICSLFELLGVTAILPFVQAVMDPQAIMEKPYIIFLRKFVSIDSSTQLLFVLGLFLIAVYLFKNAYIIWAYYIKFNYSSKVQKELSVKLLRSFMGRPYEFFLNVNSADVMRGCGADIGGVYSILSDFVSLFTEILTVALIGSYLIYTDAVIALSVLVLMAIVLLAIVVLFKPSVKKIGKRNLEVQTKRNKAIYQAICGIKPIYVMQRNDLFVKEYEDATNEARKIQRKYDTITNAPDRITEGICVSGIIGVVCIRLIFAGNDMVSFIPKLAAFAMAAFKIFPSVGKIASRMTEIVYFRPALQNVYKNIIEVEEYAKEQEAYRLEKGADRVSLEDFSFTNSIEINHISWKYRNQEKEVLKDVTISIHKGESIALIGASGSGKTTLSDVILGLLHPQSGNIKMDGVDVYAMPKQWAQIVGYVPQDVFLLDDTIRNNIRFGMPEKLTSEEKIWDALRQAQLEEFVRNLPDGLDTIVGERGVKFSGGQRQRIAIARALYNNPQLLVLDEATAALDNETESAVMESIEALQGHITMIIVAHRLSTIRNCDKIYEIVDGTAIERKKEEVLQKET